MQAKCSNKDPYSTLNPQCSNKGLSDPFGTHWSSLLSSLTLTKGPKFTKQSYFPLLERKEVLWGTSNQTTKIE